MELPMFLDVPDLPACLRWGSSGPCEEGLLTVPSYDDFNNMKEKHCIFSLDDQDESSSGLSLGSSPSNASSTMNAVVDLGLDFNFEYYNEASDHTCASMDTPSTSPSIISLPAPPLPMPSSRLAVAAPEPIGLPIGKLNLKLDASAVASAWKSKAGNAPVFRMPRSSIVTAAANIPSMEARAQSLSVETQEGWNEDISKSSRPSRNTNPLNRSLSANTKTAKTAGPSTLSGEKRQASQPLRKTSSQKRKSGGKSSDKRPRIKGRFVRRDELERLAAAKNNNEETNEEGALIVPDAADVDDDIITLCLPNTFELVGMDVDAQRAY